LSYIGRTPIVGNFVKLDAITTSATATYNLTNGGVAYYPQSANNCIVSLNGVIQSPTSAYTISGSTIVFSDALTSSDTIDFILVLGDVLSIGTPSDGTITSAKLASGVSGLISWQSVQTSGFTAVAGRGYPCNTTSSAFTVTLPASPSAGDTIILLDYAGTWDTNNLTINPNSNKILGQTSNVVASKDREALTLTYIDSTQGWLPNSGYQESTSGIGIPYSIDFLVIAGGGSGGSIAAGGGGAGGYRTSTQTVSPGTVITVTVGDGGASVSGPSNSGNSGSNSSISGSGLTTITSAGGGLGGFYDAVGGNGGSGGGGGGGFSSKAGGSGNTPSTSPSQGNNGGTGFYDNATERAAGGGGGASAVGVNGVSSASAVAGNGGAGTASSITGSSVTRAGGGGGSCNAPGMTGGSGGAGGGGAGTSGANPGTAGTANTGGGGGAAGNGQSSGAGGKGVVILSVPTASYSSTTTGSPTVTTSGSNTILQFNGSGSYTA
jgi:hypothetical protein